MLKKISSSPFFIFPLITFIFFWPLSLQIFTFKNDALTYYYPVRTLISDALNNHELPLWTPFINMGYPLHADMQSGAWSPMIWIIGFATNYSLAAFHYELLIYLALGGIGFYYLGKEYGWNKTTAFIIGIAYELSGPVIDSMQFTTCISSACYIPFIFLFFRRLLLNKQPQVNALLTAFFLYLIFTGGYPAFFIITVYLLLIYSILAFFSAPVKTAFLIKMLFPAVLVSGLFILLALPAIISFADHLQFIDRGKIQELKFILENSMPPACMFSLISPFSTTAKTFFFNTDMLMRNIYIGIVPLIFLIYAACSKTVRNNKEVQFFLITAFILFGLAWGSHFFLRQLAYYVLPLMNTFRHPALFRFFGVIFFLLAAGTAIEEWNKNNYSNIPLKNIMLAIGSIVFLIGIFIIFFSGTKLIPANFRLSDAKKLLSSLSFQQRFLMQLPFIFATLLIFYWIIVQKKGLFYIGLLSIADLFFATQINMPITVIGARTFAATVTHINRNPVKFPLPGNTTIEENSFNSIDTKNAVGSFLPFEKRIGRNDYFITPGNLSLQDKFYESPIKEPVFKNRLLYFADTILQPNSNPAVKALKTFSFAIVSTTLSSFSGTHFINDTIAIKKLSANTLECSVETNYPQLLLFLQNIYPGWNVFIDGKKSRVFTVNTTFMGVNIPAGKHEIKFSYRPKLIIYAWYVSVFTLVSMALFLLVFIGRDNIFTKYHHQRNTKRKSN